MLRRSLLVFLGFSLLALLLTVGYALMGLSGPASAIQEAERALARGHSQEALRLVAHASKSLGPTAEPRLQQRILRVRYRAHLATKNNVQARIDLEQLVEDYAQNDPELHRELIRTLILTDQPNLALRRAIRVLSNFPDDGRMLELAGEACQAMYQEKLAALLADLSAKLGPVKFREARDSLLPYLYRSSLDPLAAQGRARFDDILRTYHPQALTGELYKADLAEIRELIAKAQRYYRRTLEVPGQPVSAYRGLAYGLEQGRRLDDLVALSETYLRRFDHVYAITAAIKVLEAHLTAQRYGAAVDLTNRYLPPGTWRQRMKQGKLGAEVKRFYLLKGRALYALEDIAGLEQLNAEVEEVVKKSSLQFPHEQAFIAAYMHALKEDNWAVDRELGGLRHQPPLQLAVGGEEDYFADSIRMIVQAMERQSDRLADPLVFQERLLRGWIQFRPDEPEPYLLRTRYLLQYDRPDDAFPNADKLLRLARLRSQRRDQAEPTDPTEQPLDEQALHLYAEAADRMLRPSGRDAASLFAICVKQGIEIPRRVANNALYMPLAELALQKGQTKIALAAARRATQIYNWARWPRYLEARALMRQGKFDLVAERMETVREFNRGDLEALRLMRAARQAAGESNHHLYYDVAVSGVPDAELAMALVSNCMARHDWDAARRFAQAALPRYGTDPQLPQLLARSLAAAGDLEAAREVLAPWLRLLGNLPRPIAAEIAELYLTLASPTASAEQLQAYTIAAAELHRGNATALYRMARLLAERGFEAEAFVALRPIFEDDVHEDQRSGEHYALGGRLALALDLRQAAEDLLIASVSFGAAPEAGKLLAVQLLRADRPAEAAEAFWQEEATDQLGAVLACRFGQPTIAAHWVAQTLARDPTHVAASCLRAFTRTGGDVPPNVTAAVDQLVAGASDLLLDALAFHCVEGFEQAAFKASSRLAELHPKNPIAAYLWGRSMRLVGRYEDAVGALTNAAKVGGLLAAYDELLLALSVMAPERIQVASFQAVLARLFSEHGSATPPGVRRAALMSLAAQLATIANPTAEQIDLLARLWTEHPEETGAGRPEVATLLDSGRLPQALHLLRTTLAATIAASDDTADRAEVLGWCASSLRSIHAAAGADEELRQDVLAEVDELLQEHGPYGTLVHLYIDLTEEHAGGDRTRIELAELQRHRLLLERHFRHFVEQPEADLGPLERTLLRLIPIAGRETVLGQIDTLLHRDPSLLRIWILRATMLEEDGQIHEALHGLRWMFSYINSPEVLLTYSRIAGQSGLATQEDEDRLLRELDADWAETPEAALARGLLAYRMARHDEAIEFLTRAEPRADGAHLYFLALAHLIRPGAATGLEAARLLRRFADEYPQSDLSEIPEHLAIQLELPAEASAAAKPARGEREPKAAEADGPDEEGDLQEKDESDEQGVLEEEGESGEEGAAGDPPPGEPEGQTPPGEAPNAPRAGVEAPSAAGDKQGGG